MPAENCCQHFIINMTASVSERGSAPFTQNAISEPSNLSISVSWCDESCSEKADCIETALSSLRALLTNDGFLFTRSCLNVRDYLSCVIIKLGVFVCPSFCPSPKKNGFMSVFSLK